MSISSFVYRYRHWIAGLVAGINLTTAAIILYRGTQGTLDSALWPLDFLGSLIIAVASYSVILAIVYVVQLYWIAQRTGDSESALLAAAFKVIEMNRQHALDQYGDAEKAEGWACVRVLREAIATTTDPVPEPTDPHGSLDVAEESMREFLYDGGTDKTDCREHEAPTSDQRARELLARELDARHFPAMAAEIRAGGDNTLAAAMVNVVARAIDFVCELATATPVPAERDGERE